MWRRTQINQNVMAYGFALRFWFLLVWLLGSIDLAALEQQYPLDPQIGQDILVGQDIDGASIVAVDDYFMSSADIQEPQKTTAYVFLKINHDVPWPSNNPFEVEVNVSINAFAFDGTQIASGQHSTLKVAYGPFDVSPIQYVDRVAEPIEGAHRIEVTVDSVEPPVCPTPQDPSNPFAPCPTQVPGNVELSAEIRVERYFNIIETSPSMTVTEDPDENRLVAEWSEVEGAEEYHLEWTHVGDYGWDDVNDVPTTIPEAGLPFDFQRNSTRISTEQLSFPISLALERGYILLRVRALGRSGPEFRYPVYGQWSDNGIAHGVVIDYDGAQKFYVDAAHEADALNWQKITTFAEHGKSQERIAYYDGSLRERQNVSMIKTTNETMVGESLYDKLGRAAVQTMPVPTADPVLKYYANFNQVDVDFPNTPSQVSTPYNWRHFDGGAGVCGAGAEPLNPFDSGSANYYSEFNPALDPNHPLNTLHTSYIPKAHGYPFTQVVYTNDTTGRVRSQSGVGKHHKIGSGHESKHFYGQPSQEQLDRLFGSEVGDASHYNKNLAVDANGQVSVSYLDQQGRVIATALAGKNPENLEPLPAEDREVWEDFEANLLENRSRIAGEQHLTSTAHHLAAGSNGTSSDHLFEYNLEPQEFTAKDCPLCFPCDYDLGIDATDACGAPLAGSSLPIQTAIPDEQSCGNSQTFTQTFTAELEVGSYPVTKHLSLDQVALSEYLDEYVADASCTRTFDSFLDEELAKMDFESCDLLTDCPSICQNETNSNSGQEYDECLVRCEAPNMCEGLRDVLLGDVTPGGQYAPWEVTYNEDTGDPEYQTSETTTVWQNWNKPNLVYEPATVDLGTGDLVPVQDLSLQQFIENWNPGWAETLLAYHPESCKLQYSTFCPSGDQLAQTQYLTDMMETDSFEEAMSKGFLNPIGMSLGEGAPGGLDNSTNPDPLFANDAGLRNEMQDYLASIGLRIDGLGDLSAWELVVAATVCADLPADKASQCVEAFEFDQAGLCWRDMLWQMFRAIYLQKRNELLEEQALAKCNPTVSPDKIRRAPTFKQAFASVGLDVGSGSLDDSIGLVENMLAWGEENTGNFCHDNCNSRVPHWISQLSGCASLVGENEWQSSLASKLGEELADVCKLACDAGAPLGACSVETDSGTISFSDKIEQAVGRETIECNADLLSDLPKWEQAFLGASPNRPLDGCACDSILTEWEAYNSGGSGEFSSFEAFFEHQTGAAVSGLSAKVCACQKQDRSCPANWLEEGDLLTLNQAEPPKDSLPEWLNEQTEQPGSTLDSILGKSRVPFEFVPAPLTCSACPDCDVVFGVVDQFETEFNERFPKATDHEEYTYLHNKLLANHLNREIRQELTWDQFSGFIEQCKDDVIAVPTVCDIKPDLPDPAQDCRDNLENVAQHNAQEAYQDYLDTVKADFTEAYTAQCLDGAHEEFTVTYDEEEYHYTLYYYDQAGNLVRTIPPLGVERLGDGLNATDRKALLDQIKSDRANRERNVFTTHRMASTYTHNSLDQLVTSYMPDHDYMELWEVEEVQVDQPASNTSPALKGVHFLDEQNAIAIGDDPDGSDYTAVYRSNNGGQAWSRVNGIANDWLAGYENGNEVYLVGSKGAFARSSDGGASWRVDHVGARTDLLGINQDGASGALKAFDSQGYLYESNDNGESWSTGTASLFGGATVIDIDFNGQLGHAVTDAGDIWRSNNSGNSWSKADIEIGQPEFTDAASDGATLYALTADGKLLKRPWNDLTAPWNHEAIGPAQGAATDFKIDRAESIAIDKANGYIFVVGNNFIRVRQLSSNAWVEVNLSGVQTSSSSDFQFIAVNSSPGGDTFVMNRDGKYWQLDLVQSVWTMSNSDAAPFAYAPYTDFVADNSGPGHFLGQTNIGEPVLVWDSLTYSHANDPIVSLSMSESDDVQFLTTGKEIYQWTGTAWAKIPASGAGSATDPVTAFVSDNNQVAMLGGNGFNRISAANNLASWSSTNKLDGADLIAVDSTGGIAVGAGALLLGATNNGTNWTLTQFPYTATLTAVATDSSANTLLGTADGWILERTSGWEAYDSGGGEITALAGSAGSWNTRLIAFDDGQHKYSAGPSQSLPPSQLSTFVGDAWLIGSNGFMCRPSSNGCNQPGSEWLFERLEDIEGESGSSVMAGRQSVVLIVSSPTVNPELQVTAGGTDLNAVAQTQGVITAAGTGWYWNSAAGWNQVPGSTIKDIGFQHDTGFGQADLSKGIAVGSAGALYRLTSNGGNWISSSSPASASNPVWNAVSVINNVVYVAGQNGQIIKSEDEGNSWESLKDAGGSTDLTARHGLSPNELVDIRFEDYQSGYALTSAGAILKTVHGGWYWVTKPTNSGATAANAFASGPALALAGGNLTAGLIEDESSSLSQRFWYDATGRSAASQNSKQFAQSVKEYSYNRYDGQTRLVEVGVLASGELPNAGKINAPLFPDNWSLVRSEVVRTHYDVAITDATVVAEFPRGVQENLRGRVAWAAKHEDYDLTSTQSAVLTDGEGIKYRDDYESATLYSYDIHGNVDQLLHEYRFLPASMAHHQFKALDYEYDIISGITKHLNYQEGEDDSFFHAYDYDPDNRLEDVFTSREKVFWHNDATYSYMRQGPLARKEFGDLKVQGMDYAYTIQGWIKGVNSNTLGPSRDIGQDGIQSQNRPWVPKDTFGFSLTYFSKTGYPVARIYDYEAIGVDSYGGAGFVGDLTNNGDFEAKSPDLFNGNISQKLTALTAPDETQMETQGVAYKHDQLNRLVESRTFQSMDINSNSFSSAVDNDRFRTRYVNDSNGNIESLSRNGFGDTTFPLEMDELSFHYLESFEGKKLNNRLLHVSDDPTYTSNYPVPGCSSQVDCNEDLDDQGNFAIGSQGLGISNYSYDRLGRLVEDQQAEIETFEWNSAGKATRVLRTAGSTKSDLFFNYGPDGAQSTQTLATKNSMGDVNPATNWRLKLYVRDALGKTVSIYSEGGLPNSMETQQNLVFGSRKIGYQYVMKTNSQTQSAASNQIRSEIGGRRYELTDNLDNVHSVVTDAKMFVDLDSDATPETTMSDVMFAGDYYPFGTLMLGRTIGETEHGFGFAGQRFDAELGGVGGYYDLGSRLLDARIGRAIALDPAHTSFAYQSAYVIAGSNPVFYMEKSGERKVTHMTIVQEDGTSIYLKVVDAKAVEWKWTKVTVGDDWEWHYMPHDVIQNITYDVVTRETKYTARYQRKGVFQHALARSVDFASRIEELLTGEGGWQKGGLNLVTVEGGADPTKMKALNDVETIDVTELLVVLGKAGKNPKLPRNIKPEDVAKKVAGWLKTIVPKIIDKRREHVDSSSTSTDFSYDSDVREENDVVWHCMWGCKDSMTFKEAKDHLEKRGQGHGISGSTVQENTEGAKNEIFERQ